MNNLQSPQLLSDLYRDLRDRRLLPLVVVLIVGMVVVPIALSKSPEAAPPVAAPAPVVTKSNAPTQSVVVSDPGLRDYKRRLAGDSPKDPFIQHFLPEAGAGPAESSDAGGASAGTESASSGTDTSTGTDTSSGSSAPAPSSGGTTGQTQTKYYSYRVKVRAGVLDGTPLKVYDSVGTLANLPSNKIPAVSFLGVTKDSAFNAKTAVFLVSSAVSSVDGEGSCSFAGTACQLLSLKPGEHEDLVWTNGLTYRLELVKFNLTSVDQLPSTGKSEDNSGGRSPRKQEKKTSFYFSF